MFSPNTYQIAKARQDQLRNEADCGFLSGCWWERMAKMTFLGGLVALPVLAILHLL